MEKNPVVAEIEMKDHRLYLIHKRKGLDITRVDVTAVWHFFKEAQDFAEKE